MDGTIRIIIKPNTDSFDVFGTASYETARILRELAKRIDGHPHFSPGHDQALLDTEGIEVGYLTFTET